MKILQKYYTLVFLFVLLISTPTSAQNNNIFPERTYQVKNISPGTETSYPIGFVQFNGKVYFVARHPAYGDEVWYSDGSEGGTKILKDIRPGPEGRIMDLKVYNGKLYISADDGGDYGYGIWQSDGTEVGTHLLKDIYPDGSANPESFQVGNGLLYFKATDASGEHLWRTDGTQAGTVKITADPINESLCPDYDGIGFQNKFYFMTAFHAKAGWMNCQLVRTDGIPGHIEQVDSQETNPNNFRYLSDFAIVKDRLFFLLLQTILDILVYGSLIIATGKLSLLKMST